MMLKIFKYQKKILKKKQQPQQFLFGINLFNIPKLFY